MKIMTIIGTRPELIRLSVTIKLLDQVCDHVLVHTGQNWDPTLNGDLFKELGIREPDLNLQGGQESKFHFMSEVLPVLAAFVKAQDPDAILILGDTNSCLAAAMVANSLNIPLVHCEAGNRCWSSVVPEESNRKMIDQISDLNLVYGEQQRLNLLREGHHPSEIVKTGSPMKEVIDAYHRVSGGYVSKKPYYALTVHRAENLQCGAGWLENLVSELQKTHPCRVSCHPRLEKAMDTKDSKTYLRPQGLNDWWNIQKQAVAVLSDSGTLPEETYHLGFPALHLRHSNERPEATEAGVVTTVGVSPPVILAALKTVKSNREIIADYEVDNFAERVWSCLQSHL
jgi:UDP-N-acetyl-L-fucosamine synthase